MPQGEPITDRGEVDWDYQRRNAEAAVRSITGVKGVSDSVTLKPRISPTNVKNDILQALKRQAEREVDRMEVKVEGSTVTLTGKVNSWHERDAAQGVAWSAPGVLAVINELRVG